MRASPVGAAARWETRSTATSLRPTLPGGAVASDQVYGPAGAGNEGYGADVRIGMKPAVQARHQVALLGTARQPCRIRTSTQEAGAHFARRGSAVLASAHF
jgi:hypothetical protein